MIDSRPIGFLAAGLVLALGTPAYLAYAVPGMGSYLRHPSIVLLQAAPYLLALALWVPAWKPGTRAAAHILSGVLFVATLVLYVPVLWAPARWGGDMIGLAFAGISLAMSAAVVLVSILALVVSSLRQRRSPG